MNHIPLTLPRADALRPVLYTGKRSSNLAVALISIVVQTTRHGAPSRHRTMVVLSFEAREPKLDFRLRTGAQHVVEQIVLVMPAAMSEKSAAAAATG
ncbi:MAG TPA: hypothetical protein VL424_11400 [Pararobbsia sp.]|jgi:hypothetical protein|nr:hypothetical protein [Pararobbsia sp.]